MNFRDTRCGQALAEFTLSMGLVVATTLGAGGILQAAWKKGVCANRAFERARAALSSETTPILNPSTVYEESESEVIVQVQCGEQIERVGLKKLEHIKKWK
ncbi:MAG: hypothetical protein KGQ59_08640 [Bdellovibrionales bacterium]|nr:hypothetical protein [Bdellovibrionales bacterium]